MKLLEELGYELSDLYLYEGYLILEESTAERMIRDFLIPFLVPKLQGKLRTIAAQGTSDVGARFIDLHRLFVFLHKEPQYKKKAWVAADGEPSGVNAIAQLKEKFKDWPENHFKIFSSRDFENYYPTQFQAKVSQVLAMPEAQKRKAKGELVGEVLTWALNKPEDAKKAFQESAAEVVGFLSEIAAKIG